MEIKTKEFGEDFNKKMIVDNQEYYVKTYLGINEINDIVAKMEGVVDRNGNKPDTQLSYSAVEQILIRDVLIAKYCTNIDFDAMGFDTDVKVYDFCQAIKFNSYDIDNVAEIDEALDIDRSTYKIVEEFTKSLIQMMDKIDIGQITDAFKDAQNTIKKNENKKIVAVKGRRKKE